MRRDPDLIRELMLRLEALPPSRGPVTANPNGASFAVEGFTRDEVNYHLDLIRRSGFVEDTGIRPPFGISFRALTPASHDFVDSVRNPDAWKATKDRAGKVGNFTLGFLADLVKAWAKSEAAKHGWM